MIPNYEGNVPFEHLPFVSETMHSNEMGMQPRQDFMANQSHITENMRSILVDWLVDVSVHFEVMGETLHYAINYIDRTLSTIVIEKNKLQLVGVACMKIADVFNERSKEYYRQENASEYAYITADEYTPGEVIQMEKKILNVLNFELYSPTAVSFIKLMSQVMELPPRVTVCANYLADLMLLATNTHKHSPSLLASVYVFLAFIATEEDWPIEQRVAKCAKLCGHWYSQEEFEKAVDHVRVSWIDSRNNPNFSRFDAVNNKYDVIKFALSENDPFSWVLKESQRFEFE